MIVKSEKPFGINKDFICMGIVAEGLKEYASLLNRSTGELYIEEIHWLQDRNFFNATLHQIESDIEWKEIFKFVTEKTTIFSPRKITRIRKGQSPYFYSDKFKKTSDFRKRVKNG